MAKRFTDTEKWKDDWFISLSNDYKIIWIWLVDNCTHSGLCKRSIALLNLMCKTSITESELLDNMEGRVLIINDYWFIPKFIKFQYSTLLSGKPAILSVVKDLYQYNLRQIIGESFGNDYTIINESFYNHCQMIKDKDKVKDKVKDKDKDFKGGVGEFLKGEKFSEDLTEVFFHDGSKQKLGSDQLNWAVNGSLKPREVIKGLIY